MQPNNLAVFSPLHTGRSFICYRDVNKAIEKHRELYGLRLVLKKAIKLENYCLTLDQMRDLNFRLKYGQLDYQCSVDNGRPGRPGNDERCPRLVRLRLSPDARTLVVYDTHVHDTPLRPPAESVQGLSPQGLSAQGLPPAHQLSPEGVSPPCQVPVPVLNPPGLVPISQFHHTTPNSPCITLPDASVSVPLSTPTTLPGHEKITVKLKKSQFSPNEMVVVGSARDAQEQLELRNSPEKTPTSSYITSPVTIEKIVPKSLPKQQQLAHKFNENFVAPKVVRKPTTVRSTEKVTITPVKASTKPPGEKAIARPPDKVTIKPIEKSVPRTTERPPTKADKGVARQSERSTGKAPARPTSRSNERAAARNGAALTSAYINGSSAHNNSVRSVNGNSRKVTKKKKSKQTDHTFDLSTLAPLDTELGFTEKQQLAHGVLLRLLRVTSQLPMIEFSHALDTLETLTDAYKLEQRVNLTIRHDNEEKCDSLYGSEPYDFIDLETKGEEYYDFDASAEDHRVSFTQVDGPVDGLTDTQEEDTYIPGGAKNMSLPEKSNNPHSKHNGTRQRLSQPHKRAFPDEPWSEEGNRENELI
ncbi:hypothetical protein Pcinc_029250 [Petrolisthes cinctipes]|uniref:Uncharacterized protein n=1 Tax=Petrolisthes cinctipes TaxID=88211 RepID=A0AAE1F1X7_PETCI|nr:hypothetical protein Pcinc_029250 [Petrolisthes cinctipes]